MFERMFSTIEVFTLLAATAVFIRKLIDLSKMRSDISLLRLKLTSLDKAVLTFTILSLISILSATETWSSYNRTSSNRTRTSSSLPNTTHNTIDKKRAC